MTSSTRTPLGNSNWKPNLEHALATGDAAAMARVPKTDLHCHGLLSAPLEVYASVLGRTLTPVPRVFGSFAAFSDYIVTHLLPALTNPASVRTIIHAALDRMRADGVVYAEISFDLLIPEFLGLRVADFAALLAEECGRVAPELVVRPEIGISRVLPPDEAAARLKQWLATSVCHSIDLYDDETAGVVRDFVPLYRLAKDHGLKLKAHAGELCGAAVVRESVEALELDAIQHGVRAVEDPALVAWLAERGTALNVCPTSNYSLGVCGTYESHPARQLFDQGVRLTVNTDDFALFGASVSDELFNLAKMGFSADEIAQIVHNGLSERPT